LNVCHNSDGGIFARSVIREQAGLFLPAWFEIPACNDWKLD